MLAPWARQNERPHEKRKKKQRATLAIDATRGTPFGNLGVRC